jgi:AraC family transcriptional regulator of adaptative response/methylated-DNA-[protein]-cysteine methyltransferase
VERDRRLDGRFVYVALSTNIYCRPSCPARLPQRRLVVILPSFVEAERRGYVACRRCHPGSDSLAPAEKCIQLALAAIKTHSGERLTLDALARASGLSPNHFHRVFVRLVGISPKSFCDFQRLVRLKKHLKTGVRASIAGYGAGYGSARALYESALGGLGMTPAVYQRGGRGIGIRYALGEVALGRFLIAGTRASVCALRFGVRNDVLVHELSNEFPAAPLVRERRMPARWLDALRRATREDPLLLRMPLSTRQEVFEARVRKILSP